MSKTEKYSHIIFCLMLLLIGWLHMAIPFLVICFAYFVLNRLNFFNRKPLAVVLFILIFSGIFYGFAWFSHHAWKALPTLVSNNISPILEEAQKHNINLPFEDLDSLKDFARDAVKERVGEMGNFAKIATKEFLFLIISVVVAVSLFLRPKKPETFPAPNLYEHLSRGVAARFRKFYHSFSKVMVAQITISAINTALTALFLLTCRFPYSALLIPTTFLCGLVPIIGNLVSNSLIVCVAFSKSPQWALVALGFLLVLHKGEYFLNSKIVGGHIKTPMWITLLGLILGERILGIPGMVLAPILIHYFRTSSQEMPFTDEGFMEMPTALPSNNPKPDSQR
ncbi:MAG: rane protein [Verrucomicrobiales bacterium]|nr:rane protein [Verrucomicrobiales bacterium]